MERAFGRALVLGDFLGAVEADCVATFETDRATVVEVVIDGTDRAGEEDGVSWTGKEIHLVYLKGMIVKIKV